MQSNQPPVKFPVPFANNAGPSFIRQVPVPSQIAAQAGAASMTDGFPPLTFIPVESGGTPPFGQDTNGLLYQVTQGLRWLQAGMPALYDADFATAMGGYPAGAVVSSNILVGKFFMSTVENNATNPDAFGAGWTRVSWAQDTGDFTFSLFDATPVGWVPAKPSFTLGNASSGASYAAADAVFLFRAMWLQYPNTECPVSGGRGANPVADFNAGKTIQIKEIAGSSIIAQDYLTGRLAGVPVTSGSANAAGGVIGENLHALSQAEGPAHTHTGSGTTSPVSNDHTHNVIGSTGGFSTNHSHTGGGTTAAMNQSNPHSHSSNAAINNFGSTTGGGGFGINAPGGATINATDINHGHDFGFTTSGANVDHTHAMAFATGGISANHTHTYSFTSTNSGSGAGHNTVQRCVTGNPLFKL